MVRLDGRLIPLPYPPLTVAETKQLAYSVLTDTQKHRFEENLELDLSFGVKGLARFRANNFMQRGATAGVYRQIPYEILGFRELGLPAGRRAALRQAARPDPRHRAHGIRQDDDARGDDGQASTARSSSTSSRSKTRSSSSTRTRSASSTSASSTRTPTRSPTPCKLGPPRGPGRRARRRNARPGDDRVGPPDRRDGPPDARHPAHELRLLLDQPRSSTCSPRTSRRRSARSSPSSWKGSCASRCSSGPAARGASWRWRSWFPTPPSATSSARTRSTRSTR